VIADESGNENGYDGEEGEKDEESRESGGRKANAVQTTTLLIVNLALEDGDLLSFFVQVRREIKVDF